MTCETIGTTCKAPGEKITLEIPLAGSGFIRTWAKNRHYSSGTRVRPAKTQTAFEYECSADGYSGPREPEWTQAIGESVADGSTGWTCRAISNDSLVRTLVSCTWDGDGLTVTNQQLVNTNGEGQVNCQVSGGTSGTVSNVKATMTFSDSSIEEAIVAVTID